MDEQVVGIGFKLIAEFRSNLGAELFFGGNNPLTQHPVEKLLVQFSFLVTGYLFDVETEIGIDIFYMIFGSL